VNALGSDVRAHVPFVTLRGGLTIPLGALLLAWSLEDRGAVLMVEQGQLVVDGPSGFLTDEDRGNIRRWREHLKALVAYEAFEVAG
jgi:hypothetical protein